jgi:hypothetical protein
VTFFPYEKSDESRKTFGAGKQEGIRAGFFLLYAFLPDQWIRFLNYTSK